MKKYYLLLRVNFIVVTFMLLLPTAIGFAQQQVPPEVLQDVGSQFVCNCNCGTQVDPLDVTQCPTAKVFRAELEQLILSGKTKEEIRDYYVAQFGESILKAPMKKGFSLAIWIVPFIILLVGAVGIGYVIKKMKKGQGSQVIVVEEQQTLERSAQQEYLEEMLQKERKKYL